MCMIPTIHMSIPKRNIQIHPLLQHIPFPYSTFRNLPAFHLEDALSLTYVIQEFSLEDIPVGQCFRPLDAFALGPCADVGGSVGMGEGAGAVE